VSAAPPTARPVLSAHDGSDHAKAAIDQAGRQLHTDKGSPASRGSSFRVTRSRVALLVPRWIEAGNRRATDLGTHWART
jgi:hypothetical protein